MVARAAIAAALLGGVASGKFYFTDADGDMAGNKCLVCPTQNFYEYGQSPNRSEPFNEAEEFMTGYWNAIYSSNFDAIMNYTDGQFVPGGTLIRGGGPPMSGQTFRETSKAAWNMSGVWAQQTSFTGGVMSYFYYMFLNSLTFKGTGGPFDDLMLTIQETTKIADDFYIISYFTNGTLYSIGDGSIVIPWKAFKETSAVKKFPGVGWKIVQFVCNDYNAWGYPECSGADDSGQGAHVDWTAGDKYTVKYSHLVSACSSKCPCGEAPADTEDLPAASLLSSGGKSFPAVGGTGGAPPAPAPAMYSMEHYVVPETAGLAPGSVCLGCPHLSSSEIVSSSPSGSPQYFALDFMNQLSLSSDTALSMYAPHAIIERNGGPRIAGFNASGQGRLFFTSLWPGLSYNKTNKVSLQASTETSTGAIVEVMTNGTLFNKTTNEVAVPWMAFKVILELQRDTLGEWKLVHLSVMNFNTNGADKCSDGTSTYFNYCSPVCPCGSTIPPSKTEPNYFNATYVPDYGAAKYGKAAALDSPPMKTAMSAAEVSTDGRKMKKVRRHRLRSGRDSDDDDTSAMLQLPEDEWEWVYVTDDGEEVARSDEL